MTDYLEPSKVLELIRYVDEINLEHGATLSITDPTTEAVREIERKGAGVGLKLLRANVRHLGTEQNLQILQSIYKELETKITMKFRTEVADILTEKNEEGLAITGIESKSGEMYLADKVVIVPGRDGSEWFGNILKKQGLRLLNNQVDVGVRVETTNVVMQEINKHLYEGKFIYKSSTDQIIRSFCSNPSGHVVVENHSGVMAANGHAYKDEKLGSPNTNFALLVSHVFTEPFDKPNEYAKEVSRRANDLSNGSVIVQRFGDIKKRTPFNGKTYKRRIYRTDPKRSGAR